MKTNSVAVPSPPMDKIVEYWEKSIPMSFQNEGMSFEEKRRFRYSLQDYMHKVFNFEQFSGKTVLEIGSGSGIDSIEFARNGAKVIATDITRSGTLTTKAHFLQSGFNGYVIRCSPSEIPFKDSSLDCVYCFGVLHHIPDVEKVLIEIRRVLKKDGKILAMLYHKDSLLFAYSIVYLRGIKQGLLQKYSIDDILCMYSERNFGCPYTKAYTKEEAKSLFSKFFGNVQISVHYNVIDTEEKRKIKIEIPEDYELGWHIIVKAEKIE